jgi:hypothetical protein
VYRDQAPKGWIPMGMSRREGNPRGTEPQVQLTVRLDVPSSPEPLISPGVGMS